MPEVTPYPKTFKTVYVTQSRSHCGLRFDAWTLDTHRCLFVFIYDLALRRRLALQSAL